MKPFVVLSLAGGFFAIVLGGCSGGGGSSPLAGAPTPFATMRAIETPVPNGATAAPGATNAPATNAPIAGTTASPVTPAPSASAVAVKPTSAPPTSAPVATPSPSATSSLPTMNAMSSDAFVSTMGVDLAFSTGAEEQQVAQAVATLGVRHARIPVPENNAQYDGWVSDFFSVNPSVRAVGLTNCSPPLGATSASGVSPSDVRAVQTASGGRFDYVEGVNEPDDRKDANWVADTRSCIAPFAGGVDGVPFAAPALVTQRTGTSQLALGNISNVASVGNMHRYFAGRNPDAPGWGGSDSCGKYGALRWMTCWASYSVPNAPIVVTETGWNSDTEVDLATQAKYLERLFFVNAQAGISTTSIYTLLSYTGQDAFGGNGLLNEDYSPKPGFTAISNITKLLADPGATYSPAALHLTTSPAMAVSGAGLRVMALGKRDGSYDLALWQEVQSADPNSRGTDTVPAPVTVTLTLATPYTGTLHAWQDDGSAPASAAGSASTFRIPVTDRLSVLEIHPI